MYALQNDNIKGYKKFIKTPASHDEYEEYDYE